MRQPSLPDQKKHCSEVLKQCQSLGLFTKEDTAVHFIDFGQLRDQLTSIRSYLPDDSEMFLPIKTNPVLGVLRQILEWNYGLEAASLEELVLADAAGAKPEKMAFDSPAKTAEEIRFCDSHWPGMHIIANDLKELELLTPFSNLSKGLRINPMVSATRDATYDVSNPHSKFGEPITNRKEIIDYLQSTSQKIEIIHFHIGSKIDNLTAWAEALEIITGLVADIQNSVSNQSITALNIGGGFDALDSFGKWHNPLEKISDLIKKSATNLGIKIMTEYGRLSYTHCGWTVSEIASIRKLGDRSQAILHVGADMFVREIYQTSPPFHDYFSLDENYNPTNGSTEKYDLMGPLCFQGDCLETEVELTSLTSRDKIIITETGANSVGLWSRHCSRRMPKIIGYDIQNNKFTIIKDRESLDDIVTFWR